MTASDLVGDTNSPDPELTADQLRQLDVDGYLVLAAVLSPAECDRWSRLIDDLWEQERDKPHTFDDEPGVCFVENLLYFSAEFERCISDRRVVAAVRALLGPEVLLSLANARRADPGYGNQPLHELDRRRGKPFTACDVIWCLDEFTAENGTRVIPGSHLDDTQVLAVMTDPLAVHPDQRIVTASRGSVLLFSTSLIHAGQANSNALPRRAILSQFIVPSRKPRFDWVQLPPQIRRQLNPESLELLRAS